MKKIILFLFFVFLLITFYFFQPYLGPTVVFQIRKGESFPSINERLYQSKIIRSRSLFYRYTRYKNSMNNFKQGLYKISSGTSFINLEEMFTEGLFLKKKITIKEGSTTFDIAKSLADSNLGSYEKFIYLTKAPHFVHKYSHVTPSLEGYLFPSTYFIPLGLAEEEILSIFIDEFFLRTKFIKHSFLSFHEVITLASMIEKETGFEEHRKIAGVFFNRLKKKIKFQSDPTVIYGFLPNLKERLRKKHLLDPHPYNTYVHQGLPPGPICSPGLKSIEAVLNPEQHSYLFFVSRNDGTHIFTTHYHEHNFYVDEYQRKKNSN